MAKVYKVWLEWDFGQDNRVFKTEKSARQWIQTTVLDDGKNHLEEEYADLDELFESGLAGIETADLI